MTTITDNVSNKNKNVDDGETISVAAPYIEGIYTCPVASGTMFSQTNATLIEGIGIEGDRYANQSGTYTCFTKEPGRQLTIISANSVEEAISSSVKNIHLSNIGNLRRNIVVRGINAIELRNHIGSIIVFHSSTTNESEQQQSPQIFLHRNCVPCMYNERKNQIPGLMDCLWEVGGISCEIVRGGKIQIGDTIEIIKKSSSIQMQPNDGNKPKGFYVRPKARTTEMIKELIADKKRMKEKLQQTDPVGLSRLQKSFESVGFEY